MNIKEAGTYDVELVLIDDADVVHKKKVKIVVVEENGSDATKKEGKKQEEAEIKEEKVILGKKDEESLDIIMRNYKGVARKVALEPEDNGK